MTLATIFYACLGGIAIGLSACCLLFFNGRIAGICGILGNAILPNKNDRLWRWLFLAGLLCGAILAHLTTGLPFPSAGSPSWWLIIPAGFLVGFGTQMGSGCTSGHGVCGLGRLSIRSLIATLTFMGFGIATVFVLRHVIGGL